MPKEQKETRDPVATALMMEAASISETPANAYHIARATSQKTATFNVSANVKSCVNLYLAP
jgi:hypothetical protein